MDKDWIVLLLTLAVSLIAGYQDMKKKKRARRLRPDAQMQDSPYEYTVQAEEIVTDTVLSNAGQTTMQTDQGNSPLMEEYLRASPERRERHESKRESISTFTVEKMGNMECDMPVSVMTQPAKSTEKRNESSPPEPFDVEKAIAYAAILQPKFKEYDMF